MKKVLQRQAIVTTIKELREIIAGLECPDISDEQKVQLNIINRQKTSDTWVFER